MVFRAKGTHQFGLGSRLRPVEDVNVQSMLYPNEGGEQANWPGAGHQHRPGFPEGAMADRGNLFPCLRDDGRGFEQHTQQPEGGRDVHRVLGLNAAGART